MRKKWDRLKPGEQAGTDWLAPTYVYVFACEGHTKIGIATDPDVRRIRLQLSCPFEVTSIGQHLFVSRRIARQVERSMHEHFTGRRGWGEWFDIEPAEAMALLVELADGAPTQDDAAPKHDPLAHKRKEPTRYGKRKARDPWKSWNALTEDERLDRLREAAKALEF